jgi:hypothetical protein
MYFFCVSDILISKMFRKRLRRNATSYIVTLNSMMQVLFRDLKSGLAYVKAVERSEKAF